MSLMVELGRWPSTLDHFLPTDAWDAHRGTLARDLGDDAWRVVAEFMVTIPHIRAVAARDDLGRPLSDDERAGIEDGVEYVTEAYEALTGESPPTFPALDEAADPTRPTGTNGH